MLEAAALRTPDVVDELLAEAETTTLTVRNMDRQTIDQIKEIGDARGWTIAGTLPHMLLFVQDMQVLTDGGREAGELIHRAAQLDPDADAFAVLMRVHGLAYVKR